LDHLPKILHLDTFKLRHYIQWRKRENDYRITMIERESYIYMDSIEFADSQITQYLPLEYIPPRLHQSATVLIQQSSDEKPQEPIQVWYDQNWEELSSAPGKFYRSVCATHSVAGKVNSKDFYKNGEVQMKGGFLNDERDGIIIYYSDHHMYESAGRYRDGKRIGKWENFHNNGQFESEVYYRDGYFLKSYWDSTGVQQVKDGFGHVVRRYTNGVIAEEGAYRNGRQQDLWIGRHPNGQLYLKNITSMGG